MISTAEAENVKISKYPYGLGLIVPAMNTVLERDAPRLPYHNVSFHFTRIPFLAVTEKELEGIASNVGNAAGMLASARGVRAVALACTSGSFLHGPDYDMELIAKMEASSGLPCITTSSAVVEGMRKLHLKKPAVFTPYPEWVARRCERYLIRQGFHPVSLHYGFGCEPLLETDVVQPLLEWIQTELTEHADSIFVSCTNFSWFRTIQELEDRLSLPVITSNQATISALLRRAEIHTPIPGYGMLLAQPSD